MGELFNYQVVGASKIATGTPSAFCREIIGGNFILRSHDTAETGAGGQYHSRKGTLEAELSLRVIAPALADIALWFPTTAGVQVAAFPDFLVEADDGTSGKEYLLSDGQPGTIRVSCAETEDAQVIYEVMAKFATPTPQAIGTDVPVYSALLGHTINDVTVGFGTDGDKECLSFDLANDLGVSMNNPMKAKDADSKTLPNGYFIDPAAPPTFSCVTADMYQGEAADIVGDTWTPITPTIALANGTGAQDITFTLTNYKPEGDAFNMPVEGRGRIGFAHNFGAGSGTVYNRVGLA